MVFYSVINWKYDSTPPHYCKQSHTHTHTHTHAHMHTHAHTHTHTRARRFMVRPTVYRLNRWLLLAGSIDSSLDERDRTFKRSPRTCPRYTLSSTQTLIRSFLKDHRIKYNRQRRLLRHSLMTWSVLYVCVCI